MPYPNLTAHEAEQLRKVIEMALPSHQVKQRNQWAKEWQYKAAIKALKPK